MDKDRMDDEPLQDDETTSKDTPMDEKQNRNDLYQDLPKEVVDILMQTHPLLAKEETQQETDFSKTKRMSKEDREEIRAERRKILEEERKEQESYIPRSKKNTLEELQEEVAPEEEKKAERNSDRQEFSEKSALKEVWTDDSENDIIFQEPIIMTSMGSNEEEDDNEKVQLVKMKMPNKRRKMPRGVQVKEKKKRKQKEDTNIYPEEDLLDFRTKAKEEHLDQLYQEYDEDDDETYFGENSFGEKRGYILIGVVAFLLLVLTIRSITLGSKLKKAEEEVAKQVDISQKYEELQLENLSLKEQIKILNGEEVPTVEDLEEDTQKPKIDDGHKKTETKKTVKYDTYTTKENDTFWDISKAVYGNGAYYTKILEANGMSENDYIQPGKKLKIPKLEQ